MPKPQLFGPFLQERLTTAYTTAIVTEGGVELARPRRAGGGGRRAGCGC